MPRTRTYKCGACGRTHPKPTGKHCQWPQLGEDTDPPNVAQEVDTTEVTSALRTLTENIGILTERMTAMEQKADRNTQPQPIANTDPEGASGTSEQQAAPQEKEIPSVRDLRRDYELGREVNRRLAELELDDDDEDAAKQPTHRTRGKKSGAARTVQDSVLKDIDWPHFHIYTPPGTEPMTFLRLSVQEFTYGFMQMIDRPDARFDRQVMWNLLKDVMEDATEYPWANVLNFFLVVGSNIENDRLRWTDTDEIQKLRIKHSQKHEIVQKKAQQQAPEKPTYCGPYQKGQCPEKGDHAGVRHICAYCLRVNAGQYPHPETNCRRKGVPEVPKNVKGGE